jgi:hypothetical protein
MFLSIKSPFLVLASSSGLASNSVAPDVLNLLTVEKCFACPRFSCECQMTYQKRKSFSGRKKISFAEVLMLPNM